MSFSYPTRQTGIALVLVLWIISLLTVMALGLTTTQRTESALTQNQLDGARFRAMAEAAINLTVLNLLSTPLETESAGKRLGAGRHAPNADVRRRGTLGHAVQ